MQIVSDRKMRTGSATSGLGTLACRFSPPEKLHFVRTEKMSTPVLHLGQSATNVGAEMASICSTFNWDPVPSLAIDSSLSDTDTSMRCQCSSIFSLPAPGSAFIESVVEKIFSTIESCDSLSTMVVTIDGFGYQN